MRIIKNKKFNDILAKKFGFKKKKEIYEYNTDIMNGEFLLSVKISPPNNIKTVLTEKETNEQYTLHLSNISGNFVSQVREEYFNVIDDIIGKCFDNDVFKSLYTKKIIEYIKDKYNDDMEYLWEKFPNNAVARRKDNKKWYIVILTVNKNKLGIKDNEYAEVADLRAKTENIENLLKKDNIYKGYHMNKKNWITIILDGSIPVKEIYEFIDESYLLAGKK